MKMAGSHSRLPPSSAHRWMLCGQSVVPVVGAGIEEDSDASREGTAAHTLGEICLNDGSDSWWHIGKRIYGDELKEGICKEEWGSFVEITAEMANRVQARLDYVRASGSLDASPGEYNHWCERRLDHKEFHPDLGGTIDDILIDKWGRCEVIDYKDGFIQIDPERNPQLMSYAWLAALKNSGLKHFKLTIIQPKNEANPIRSWEISREELELWAYLELLPAMEKAGTGEYVMGDHCKYCPRLKALQCPAHERAVDNYKEMEENEPDMLQTISAEHLAGFKKDSEPVLRFFKAVDDELSRRLLTLGQDVPGWKVVEKRADRIWKDQSALDQIIYRVLGEDSLTEPKLKSPAQIEKLPGGAQLVAEWAYKPKTGLTIAPNSDKRLAVSAIEVYKDVV